MTASDPKPALPPAVEAERATFDEWAAKAGICYLDGAWRAWQARAALSSQPAASGAPAVRDYEPCALATEAARIAMRECEYDPNDEARVREIVDKAHASVTQGWGDPAHAAPSPVEPEAVARPRMWKCLDTGRVVLTNEADPGPRWCRCPDADHLSDTQPAADPCFARAPEGPQLCDRPKGHKGEHQALVTHYWPREAPLPSPSPGCVCGEPALPDGVCRGPIGPTPSSLPVVSPEPGARADYDFDAEARRVCEATGSRNGHGTVAAALREAFDAGVGAGHAPGKQGPGGAGSIPGAPAIESQPEPGAWRGVREAALEEAACEVEDFDYSCLPPDLAYLAPQIKVVLSACARGVRVLKSKPRALARASAPAANAPKEAPRG